MMVEDTQRRVDNLKIQAHFARARGDQTGALRFLEKSAKYKETLTSLRQSLAQADTVCELVKEALERLDVITERQVAAAQPEEF